jgi:hypothetical protein
MKKLFGLLFVLTCFLMPATNSFGASYTKQDIIAKYEWSTDSNTFEFEADEGRQDVFQITFTTVEENGKLEPTSIQVSWDANKIYVVEIVLEESTTVHTYTITGNSWDSSNFDYDHAISNITIYVSSSVPIPGAVWLLGSGILGLAGIRIRSRKRKAQS